MYGDSVPNLNQMCILSLKDRIEPNEMLSILYETFGNDYSVQCLQRKSPTCYIVVLHSVELCDMLVNKSFFLSRGHKISVLSMSSDNVVTVTIKGLLPTVPCNVIASTLSAYGKILSIWKETYKLSPHVFTGNTKLFIAIEKNIPPYICVWGQKGMVYLKQLRKLCWRCGSSNHLLAQCSTIRCSVCRNIGHFSYRCPLIGRRNVLRRHRSHSISERYLRRNSFYNFNKRRRGNSFLDHPEEMIRNYNDKRSQITDYKGNKRGFDADEPKHVGYMDWTSEESRVYEEYIRDVEQAFSKLGISYLHHINKKLKLGSRAGMWT